LRTAKAFTNALRSIAFQYWPSISLARHYQSHLREFPSICGSLRLLSMRRFAASIAILLATASAAPGEGPSIDFDTQIVPVLTKSGCNAGACHGAAAGVW
jgi:hypothetical protein